MSWQTFRSNLTIMPLFIRALLKHPVAFVKASWGARTQAKELMTQGYELPYEIPEYGEGMPCCKSKEKYLRPTPMCESDAVEIIALSNKLGAFQKSDREYAEACFDFVKRNIQFSFFAPLQGAVGTLKAGRGICMDNMSLFVALCRTAGIPARYKIYNEAFATPLYELFTADSPILKDWYDAMGHFIMHGSCEALIEGKWVVGEFVLPPELEAALGLPLSYLGEDASGVWCYPIPDATRRLETLPRGLGLGMRLMMRPLGGLFMGVELRLQEKLKEGARILEEMGEEEYDRRIRKRYRFTLPRITLEKLGKKGIITDTSIEQ